MLSALKANLKTLAAKTVWAYGPQDVVKKLRLCGVIPGTTLVVHSSWLQNNGFRGKPSDLVKALKNTVGKDGLLVMTSMPYHNMSSAQWLAKDKPMNVRRSPSMMGLVSEVFRRSEGVYRSLSATHPLLAWGNEAEAFVAGHENTDRPFGSDSPFAKLLDKNAIILGFDAAFSAFTFTHFIEDQIAHTLPIALYEPELVRGTIVDADGATHEQWVRVLAVEANSLRREHRLVEKLKKNGLLHQSSIGHTTLTWIRASDVLAGARNLIAEGTNFFDAPKRNHS